MRLANGSRDGRRFGPGAAIVALLAIAAILVAVWRLESQVAGLRVDALTIEGTPATVWRPAADAAAAPAVVIAHGFAGSRPLMRAFATTLARNGYIAVSFDFLGHGANPTPLPADITSGGGASAALTAEMGRVIAAARLLPGVDGRVAVLGHSMGADITVKAARASPDVAAAIAVSIYSEAVTPTEPRNLLMVTGGWEGFLRARALAATSGAIGRPAEENATYGDPRAGDARRAAVADGVEHVGVLFSRTSLAEATAWLDAVFDRDGPPEIARPGPWILLLLAGVVALAWPVSRLSPRVPRPQLWRRGPPGVGGRVALALGPAIATPLLLAPAPTEFLPVLVADYLAVHLALYGGLTALGLWRFGMRAPGAPTGRLIAAVAAATLFGIAAIGLPLDIYVASFAPHAGRLALVAALAIGAIGYALADAWLAFDAPRWSVWLNKLAFLGSLALAVALDPADLFFLIIIFPVVVLFFLLYGLWARWAAAASGHPSVAGVAVGAAFAWALGATFPLVAP